jgi:hypothetical protein
VIGRNNNQWKGWKICNSVDDNDTNESSSTNSSWLPVLYNFERKTKRSTEVFEFFCEIYMVLFRWLGCLSPHSFEKSIAFGLISWVLDSLKSCKILIEFYWVFIPSEPIWNQIAQVRRMWVALKIEVGFWWTFIIDQWCYILIETNYSGNLNPNSSYAKNPDCLTGLQLLRGSTVTQI